MLARLFRAIMDANQDVEEEIHRIEVILLVYIGISSLILAIAYGFMGKVSSEEVFETTEEIAGMLSIKAEALLSNSLI